MITISLMNMKGGVGKTTLAVNIADFLAKRHSKKVLLIDLDPQFNATQCLMKGDEYINYRQENETTVIDIFREPGELNISVVSGISGTAPKPFENIRPLSTSRGFDLIPGNLELAIFEMSSGQGTEFRLNNYIHHIKKNLQQPYDICIIDCPPTPSVWMTSGIIASDYYLIPSKPDPISLIGLDLLEAIIRKRKNNYGCKCKCLGLVLTMVETNTNLYQKARENFSKEEQWAKYLYKGFLLKRTIVAQGQTSGTFIMDISDSKLNKEFANIVNELTERMETENGN